MVREESTVDLEHRDPLERAAKSMPRSLRIASTHFGVRQVMDQFSCRFCAFRKFPAIFGRCRHKSEETVRVDMPRRHTNIARAVPGYRTTESTPNQSIYSIRIM